LYVAGGVSIEKGFLQSVEWTKRRANGELEPWRPAPPLGVPRGFLALISAQGYLYAIGGSNDQGGRMTLLRTVERAKIEADGGLGPWVFVSPLLTPRRGPAALISHGFLYVIGGYNGLFLKTLERATLGVNGELGEWKMARSTLTTDRYIHGAAIQGDFLYVVGGHVETVGGGKASTEWARIGSDGELQPWQSAASLWIPRFLAAVTSTRGALYVLGGYNGNYLASVERAVIREDGSLSAWSSITPLERPKEGSAVAALGDTIYLAGGSEKGIYLRDVALAQVGTNGELGHWESR